MEYDELEAKVIAMIMCQFNERMSISKVEYRNKYVITYSLQKAMKKWGGRAKQSVTSEMKQLHNRECFYPIQISEISQTEYERALESLIFLVKKRDSSLKSSHVTVPMEVPKEIMSAKKMY